MNKPLFIEPKFANGPATEAEAEDRELPDIYEVEAALARLTDAYGLSSKRPAPRKNFPRKTQYNLT